jgi:MFS family permease
MPFDKLFGLCDAKWLYIVCVVLFFGVGTVLGPIIGGGFEKYTWRWVL